MESRDKKGDAFQIRIGRPDDIPRLLEMYARFQPKGRYQGLPPHQAQACRCWIEHLFQSGCHHLAWRDCVTIGHAALLPDWKRRDGEYLVFVQQEFRGLGIGTALTRMSLTYAADQGLTTIWLTVDCANLIAIRLYRKCGFEFCDDACWDMERQMTLVLPGDDETQC
jgi:RimJ/RimL family protein N-acetyltransferase